MGRPFIIKTDQRSLKFLLDQKLRQESQHPWLLKLVGFHYLVDVAADALSRRDEEIEEGGVCKIISVVEPSWLQPVKEMVASAEFFRELQQKVNSGALFSTLSQY